MFIQNYEVEIFRQEPAHLLVLREAQNSSLEGIFDVKRGEISTPFLYFASRTMMVQACLTGKSRDTKAVGRMPESQTPDQASNQSGGFEIVAPGRRSGNCTAFSIAGRICRTRLTTYRNPGASDQHPGHTTNTGFFRSTDTMRMSVDHRCPGVGCTPISFILKVVCYELRYTCHYQGASGSGAW